MSNMYAPATTTNSTKSNIDRLLRVFGSQLDRDVLESVLEISNGDFDQAMQFLELQGTQPDNYYNPVQENTIPKDYMQKPNNWVNPTLYSSERIDDNAKVILEMKKLFLKDLTFEEHLSLQCNKKKYVNYSSVLVVMLSLGVDFSHATKSKILASAWARRDYTLADHLLSQKSFLLPEVLRAIRILDTPRKIRQIEKQISKIHSRCIKKLNTLQNQISQLEKECKKDTKVSVSGSLAKHVKKWVQKIPKKELEFYALHMPSEPWQDLADIIHLSPSDFNLDYFLKFSFEHKSPEGSVVEYCSNKKNLVHTLELVQKYEVPYSYLRKNVSNMSKEVKIHVAGYETLETIIWWYEELVSSGGGSAIDKIIGDRLDLGEIPDLPYGKLMERMLYFFNVKSKLYDKLLPIAEQRLKEISLELEQPVVVLGDASFSMDVAIRTATIISSVLCAIADADLKFFNVTSYSPDFLPKTASDVLKITLDTKAEGLTAPACTLEEYYKKKKVVKLFIMVTDEIENEKFSGTYFGQLFYKYYTEVYPSRIVMVSFLDNPQEKGRMVKALESFGINPIQFCLDAKRPDLTRLDKLLGLLCSETNFFVKKAKMVSELFEKTSFKEALQVKFEKIEKLEKSDKVEEKLVELKKMVVTEEIKREIKVVEINEDVEDVKKCPICMERDKDMAVQCGHIFCGKCLEDLRSKECPTCRQPIKVTFKVYI